jgi:hypothetical protein
MDAGIVIGSLVLLASLVTLVLTWPTRRRRGLGKKSSATSKDTDTDTDADADTDATAEAAPAADGTAGSEAEGAARTRHTV